MFKTLIGVIVVAVGVIVTFMFIDPNIAIKSTDNSTVNVTDIASVEEGYIGVTIEGEVAKPGNYVLEEGAMIGDLIEMAGGETENADELAYIETAPLKGGVTYYIASKYDTSDVCKLTDITKVNINTATAEEMQEISVFSKSISSSIVSYRTENGKYNTIEDILEVYGIGNATYRKLRNYITLRDI